MDLSCRKETKMVPGEFPFLRSGRCLCVSNVAATSFLAPVPNMMVGCGNFEQPPLKEPFPEVILPFTQGISRFSLS